MSLQSKPIENSPHQKVADFSGTSKMIEPRRNRRFKPPQKLVVHYDEISMKQPDQEVEKKEDDKDESKRLSNFIKLNHSHRWIWYEFGNSLVDSAILRGNNELGSFLYDYNPTMKGRLLPLRCWHLLRRSQGKARRFSAAFIVLELKDLEHSRTLVRQLQQGMLIKRRDHCFLEQIYRRVPLPLAVNAMVFTCLPGHGIMDGVVASFEPQDSTYLVKCVLNGRMAEFRICDYFLQSSEDFIGLPLANVLEAIDPNRDIFKLEPAGKVSHSPKLLDAVVQVKNLLAIKEKTIQQMAEANDDAFVDMDTRRTYADTIDSQMFALVRVNEALVDPMMVLHEHLGQYQQQLKEQKAKMHIALGRYLKCCQRAEKDLQNAEKNVALRIKSAEVRDLIQFLQTMMYITGELMGPHSADMRRILDNLTACMVKNLPPELGALLAQMTDELQPLRQRLMDMFKKHAAQPGSPSELGE